MAWVTWREEFKFGIEASGVRVDQGSTVTTCRSMATAPAYPEPESQNFCQSKVKRVTPSSRLDRLLSRLNRLAGLPKARRREVIGDISVRRVDDHAPY